MPIVGGKPKFSKKQKKAYAKKMRDEELVTPPKNPPPAWLWNPELLPKKPPIRVSREKKEDES
jgi:hypothetical protein